GSLRHTMDQATEVLHVAFAGGVEHSASAKEQKTLEYGVIEYVKKPCGQRQRRRIYHRMRLECERKAEANKNDADIFNRVIGEQPLQIVLHQGIEHAHHRGDTAYREHEHAPPPDRRTEQIERNAHKAIDRDLGHDPAHQRGYMT